MCIALVPDSLKKHQSHSTCIKDGLPPIINVRLEFNNGAVSTIRLDPFAGERNLEISIFQHQGILRADLFKGTARAEFFADVGKQGQGEVRNIWPLDELAVSRPEDDEYDFILHECLSFIRNIQNNIPSVSSLEQGCEALKIARNVYRKIFVTSE